ncbi:50S ribosomal protein L29 [Halomicronema hongdechloris C2206]|uniref:Large ribosomal subunit protein uL29 n=1 Tax=Halomicronema hongdechloris C2206 TaxID=1641165 RepID=A0A1Z3HVI7_9CYAN|nr:50S ribosomal protein L29 [Halomicronema hongdechloris]ASC74309.1 50S ribosomal protein L29 [Halomicronema hongdechloris C2206]
MPLPSVEDARQLNDQELADAIVATKRQLFDLRFQKATRQLEREVHQFKHTRHRLAQLMTVQRERQLAALQQDSAANDQINQTDSE